MPAPVTPHDRLVRAVVRRATGPRQVEARVQLSYDN